MEYQSLCHISTKAPALNRGLAVLTLLGEGAPQTLEAVSSMLRLPKSSVLRLLETLQQLGAVERKADKSYEALWGLRALKDPRQSFRQRVERQIGILRDKTGCTVEWYEPLAGGMKLCLQENPDSELYVKAKPGFLRKWNGEFDAVARLGHAFAKEAPAVREVTVYVSNGVMKTLPAGKARQLLDTVRVEKSACDLCFNSNGVRRVAIAVFESGIFYGALAVAEAFHFDRCNRTNTYLKILNSVL